MSRLATKVRPRYHICGGKDVFYARQPYLNKDLGAGGYLSGLVLLTSQSHCCPEVPWQASASSLCMEHDLHRLFLWPRFSTWFSVLLHLAIAHGTATAA